MKVKDKKKRRCLLCLGRQTPGPDATSFHCPDCWGKIKEGECVLHTVNLSRGKDVRHKKNFLWWVMAVVLSPLLLVIYIISVIAGFINYMKGMG